MAATDRLGLTYPDAYDDPYFATFVTLMEQFDNLINNAADWRAISGAFTRTADNTFTVLDNAENQAAFVEGRPIRYRQTAGTWRYGIVKTYVTGTVTLAGAPMTDSDDDEIQFGDMARVVQMEFNIPGFFADAADTTLLESDLDTFIRWRLGEAYLVRIVHRVATDDSGANQPRVNVSVGSAKVCTANSNEGRDVAEAWITTGIDINATNYELSLDDGIEVTTDANGTNNDAKALSVSCTVVIA